ncbi:MAG: hypothetical protein NZ602_08640 [Thermoguttaceae bacterium]|nr:hypothetical protein [Thermoguttaceae bacterium]MDW8037054.1 hypothetical protein [Thermoguttaceae bacterium]
MLPSDPTSNGSSQPAPETSDTKQTHQTEHLPGSARLIVCEQSGVWAPAMLRAEPKLPTYWKRFRSWSAAWQTFQARPGSFLVVELTPDLLPEILNALRWIESFGSQGRLAVVAPRRWAQLEWMFRQAGVVHFTTSPRQVGFLVQMALRHLKRQKRPVQGLTQRIWRRLPWPKVARK